MYVRQFKFHDVHQEFGTTDVGVGADEGTRPTLCMITRSDPWCSCGWVTHLRSQQHVTDDGVAFVAIGGG